MGKMKYAVHATFYVIVECNKRDLLTIHAITDPF